LTDEEEQVVDLDRLEQEPDGAEPGQLPVEVSGGRDDQDGDLGSWIARNSWPFMAGMVLSRTMRRGAGDVVR